MDRSRIVGLEKKCCSINNCSIYNSLDGNYKRPRSYYRFPKDYERCYLWAQLCSRADLEEILIKFGSAHLCKNYYVCSDHFLLSDYNNPRNFSQGLKKMAVPSVNLTPQSSPIVSFLTKAKEASIPSEVEPATISKETHSVSVNAEASTDCKRGGRKRYLNESKEEDIEIKPVNSSQGFKAKNYFKEHKSHAGTGDCSGSAFCSHYISLIEEKARNHKLNRKVEELEERIMCLEDILITQNLPITYIKQEVDEDQESNYESMDDNA